MQMLVERDGFLQALAHAGGTVEIRYNSAADPVLMSLAGADIGLQVLMPIRHREASAMDEAA